MLDVFPPLALSAPGAVCFDEMTSSGTPARSSSLDFRAISKHKATYMDARTGAGTPTQERRTTTCTRALLSLAPEPAKGAEVRMDEVRLGSRQPVSRGKRDYDPLQEPDKRGIRFVPAIPDRRQARSQLRAFFILRKGFPYICTRNQALRRCGLCETCKAAVNMTNANELGKCHVIGARTASSSSTHTRSLLWSRLHLLYTNRAGDTAWNRSTESATSSSIVYF